VKKTFFGILAAFVLVWLSVGAAGHRPENAVFAPGDGTFESCTSILVGKLASADGSTMTSHSCDSMSDRTWITVVPHLKHKPGEMCVVYHNSKEARRPDDKNRLPSGEIRRSRRLSPTSIPPTRS